MKLGSIGNGLSAISSYGDKINKSMKDISSGSSINSASDNVANLQISERMKSLINGTRQAINNSQDGISLAQTAESALSSTSDSLQRMRDLAVQASTGTLTDADRASLDKEFSQLKEEVSRTAQTTAYNGKNLLNGSLNADIGTSAEGSGLNVAIPDMSSSGLGIDSLSIGSADGAADAIGKIDTAIKAVSDTRANLGDASNTLADTVSNLETSVNNLEASESVIADADMAKAAMELTKNKMLEQASIAMLVHKKQDASNVLSLLR